MREVSSEAILKIVKLDLLTASEVEELAKVIGDWRDQAMVMASPNRKKGRAVAGSNTPIAQPSFVQDSRKCAAPNRTSIHTGAYTF